MMFQGGAKSDDGTELEFLSIANRLNVEKKNYYAMVLTVSVWSTTSFSLSSLLLIAQLAQPLLWMDDVMKEPKTTSVNVSFTFICH